MVEKKIRKTITQQKIQERANEAQNQIEEEDEVNGGGELSVQLNEISETEIGQDSIIENGKNELTS